MDKKESKTAEVNGCKSKIGKVRKWKGGGKCRRIRISRAADVRRPRESGESFQKLLLSDCANKKREKEKGRAQDRLVAFVSAGDGESGAEIKRRNSILLLNKKVLARKPS